MSREAVFEYAMERYGVAPEFMWAKHAGFGVLRHKNNNKWFGLVMPVRKDRLGLAGSDEVDVINVKCDPDLIIILRGAAGILPGYHMNKENWISVLLDGTLADDKVFELIDASYRLTE